MRNKNNRKMNKFIACFCFLMAVANGLMFIFPWMILFGLLGDVVMRWDGSWLEQKMNIKKRYIVVFIVFLIFVSPAIFPELFF